MWHNKTETPCLQDQGNSYEEATVQVLCYVSLPSGISLLLRAQGHSEGNGVPAV